MIKKENKVLWIGFFSLLAMIGMHIHNSDLPDLTLLSPENSIPSLLWIVLFLLWWSVPNKLTNILLLSWALLNFVGGLLSAIPFSFWSLGKLQIFGHLFNHAVYALAQVPLIIFLLYLIRKRNY